MWRAVFILAAVLSGPARACGIALVLAVDVSGSVDRSEYDVQMQGLAQALRDSAVSEALVGLKAHVALVQWTGSSRQDLSLPFRQLDHFDKVEALADDIANAPRAWRNFSTAVGEALRFSLSLFDAVPGCKRKVIDISGDGVSNEGLAPAAMRPALAASGVTVNALVIEGAEEDLTAWYWENVIIGEGAFVATANGYAEYPARIRQKLLRELTKQTAMNARQQ